MKTKFALLAFLVAARAAFAAPLPTTTAVHAQPDANSPAIATLKAGTEPKPAANALSAAPSGWLAVELEGPFEGYVPNKDIAKSLDVKIGAQIRVAPKNDATVITTMEAADKSEITGLHGRWTQVKIEKTITGYIYLGTTQLRLAALRRHAARRRSRAAPTRARRPRRPGRHRRRQIRFGQPRQRQRRNPPAPLPRQVRLDPQPVQTPPPLRLGTARRRRQALRLPRHQQAPPHRTNRELCRPRRRRLRRRPPRPRWQGNGHPSRVPPVEVIF